MTPTPQDDRRPILTPASGPPDLGPLGSSLPLLSLRGERHVIPPDDCRLGPRCLVCVWRRAGLLDKLPDTEAA